MKKKYINKKMKIIFNTILMISIIFFSNEQTTCNSDSACREVNKEAICNKPEGSILGFCTCMDGYERVSTICVKNVDINEHCDNVHELCNGVNQECFNTICSCKSGFIYSNKTKKCESIIKYGEICDDDICETKQKCGSESKCSCIDGYVYDDNEKKCQKKVGINETCDDYDVCGENLGCYDSICSCDDNYVYNETEKICQKAADYYEACDNKYDICRENLICNNSICICQDEYTYSYTDSICIQDSNLDDSSYSKFIKFNILFFICLFL